MPHPEEQNWRAKRRAEQNEDYLYSKRVYWYSWRKRWKGRLVIVAAAIALLVILQHLLFH